MMETLDDMESMPGGHMSSKIFGKDDLLKWWAQSREYAENYKCATEAITILDSLNDEEVERTFPRIPEDAFFPGRNTVGGFVRGFQWAHGAAKAAFPVAGTMAAIFYLGEPHVGQDFLLECFVFALSAVVLISMALATFGGFAERHVRRQAGVPDKGPSPDHPDYLDWANKRGKYRDR